MSMKFLWNILLNRYLGGSNQTFTSILTATIILFYVFALRIWSDQCELTKVSFVSRLHISNHNSSQHSDSPRRSFTLKKKKKKILKSSLPSGHVWSKQNIL